MDIEQQNAKMSYKDERRALAEEMRPVVERFDLGTLIGFLESKGYDILFQHYAPDAPANVVNNHAGFIFGKSHTYPAVDGLDFGHEDALTLLCGDGLEAEMGEGLRMVERRGFTPISCEIPPEELAAFHETLREWAMDGATATLAMHNPRFGPHAVPIRDYTIGAPEHNKFGQECAVTTWTHARRQSPDRHWVYPNGDFYITIEADGATVFDSRELFAAHGETDSA